MSALVLLNNHLQRRDLSAGERDATIRVIQFIERRPNCFERSCLEGHVTGSAWILDSTRQKVLLTHHKKLNLWLQPGGHADGDSDILRVAWREAREESGIDGVAPINGEIFDVDVHLIPARKDEPQHYHYDVRFAFVAPEGAQFVVSEESHDLRWVSRQELSQLKVDQSVERMAEKWQPQGA